MSLVGQRLQHRGIGSPRAGFHPLAAGQFLLVEQHLAQLLRAADIERMAGEAMAILLHHRHPSLEIHRHAAQVVGVDLDAGALHLQQDRQQPALHLLIQRQRRRSAAASGCSASHSRSATSASSAAYAVARSIGTCANGSRLRPVPVTSS